MVGVVLLVLAAVAVVWWVIWFRRLPPERKAQMREEAKKHRAAQAQRTVQKDRRRREAGTLGNRQQISRIGDRSQGGLACPRCGGTQFTAKRSMKGKSTWLLVGPGALLAPKTQVKCVTCGAMFKRG